MPRLHLIPLRSTTPPSYFRTSATDLIPSNRKNDQSRGDTDIRPTASTLHTPIRVEMFRGRATPLSWFGPQSRGLIGTGFPAGVNLTSTETQLAPNAILCSKHPKGKNPHPARAGILAEQ